MKRFLSIAALLTGLTAIGTVAASCITQGVVETFTDYAAVPMIVCLAVGVVFTFLGVFGIIRLNQKEKKLPEAEAADRKKKNRSIYVFSGIFTAIVAVLIILICGRSFIMGELEQLRTAGQQQKQLDAAEALSIDPLAEASGSCAMPEGARYILYDADKGTFELDPKTQLLGRVTSKPAKASVLVRYGITTEEIGAWYTQSDNYIAKAYEQTIHIDVICIDGWSLIDSVSITSDHTDGASGDDHTYNIDIYSDNVRKYLNDLFEQ